MNVLLQKSLIDAYPKILTPDHNKNVPYDVYGIECDDGWYKLLDTTFKTINNHLESNSLNDFKIVQIKEKLGKLRMWCLNSDTYITGVLSLAHNMSENTCELCGSIENVHLHCIGALNKTLCKYCKHEWYDLNENFKRI